MIMRKFIGLVALLLGCLRTVEAQPDSSKVDLRLQLRVGQAYALHRHRTATVTCVMGRGKVTLQGEDTVDYELQVLNLDEQGIAAIKLVFRGASVIHDPGSVTFYSPLSAMKSSDTLIGKAFQGVVGRSVLLKLDPTGHVTWQSEEPAPQPRRALVEHYGAAGAQKAEVEIWIKGRINELVEDFRLLVMARPSQAVGIGDAWSAQLVTQGTGTSMSYHTTYTIKQRQEHIARIEAHSKMAIGPAVAPVTGYQPAPWTGFQQGNIEVDDQTGWPLKGRLESHSAAIYPHLPGTLNTASSGPRFYSKTSISYTITPLLPDSKAAISPQNAPHN